MGYGFYERRQGVINERQHIQRLCLGTGLFLVSASALAMPQCARHFRAGSIGRFHGLRYGAGQCG